MGIDFIISFIAAILSLIAGGVASTDVFHKLIFKILGKKRQSQSYSERLSELTINLTKSSREVDTVLSELYQVAKEREKTVNEVDSSLAHLEQREKELKEKIDTLQKVPIPVAEHFAKLVEPGEKRSAHRDYLLFGAGVIVSTVIAIIIQIFAGKK